MAEGKSDKNAGVTPEQAMAGFKIPAPWGNKTIITASAGGTHVRLTFMETHADENLGVDIAEARTAVTMSIPDLISLRDLLSRFISSNMQAVAVKIGPDGKAELVPSEPKEDG